ncbi:sensor histidine kinase [Miniphocaeibacter massiliensis]|uniref:sensor histidine kinase n=1 Tax=Miniphocaeibacter massiliensis TaxID=2041841 RepID=UPI000C1C1447|nr:sensor histidine kinase [Miniphocaeibacter massiliensis]
MKNLIEANKSYLISGAIFTLIYLLMFFIYRLDILIALYGFVMYVVISIPIIVYRTFKYKNTIKELKNLVNNEYKEEFENVYFENNSLEKSYYKIYKKKTEDLITEKEDKKNLLEEKNEYLTMWVHQVKTPMSVISLIADKDGDNRIKTEVLKANEYIDQMINYMKFESFSQDYVFKKVNLNKLVNSVIKKYRLLFFEKNLYVNLDIEDIDVLTDEKWLSFVLQQIVFNSLKYTESGGIKIYTEKENSYVIHIVDTGMGIPEEDLKNIVKWGFTGENGRLDKNSTGIGLYLVDKILKNFNYDYEINSEINKGTEFTINLKRKEIIIN